MKRSSSILFTAGMTIAVLALAVSCKHEVEASGKAVMNAPSKQIADSPKVAKIVFIGKKNACDCTRKRVYDSFTALQTALDGRTELAIEQLQVDVDQASVAQYQKMRPIMVLPAIYLLAGSGALVDVLQGEVTAEQITGALHVKKSTP